MFYDVDVFDCDGYVMVSSTVYFTFLTFFFFIFFSFLSLSCLLKNMERELDNSISIYVLNFN